MRIPNHSSVPKSDEERSADVRYTLGRNFRRVEGPVRSVRRLRRASRISKKYNCELEFVAYTCRKRLEPNRPCTPLYFHKQHPRDDVSDAGRARRRTRGDGPPVDTCRMKRSEVRREPTRSLEVGAKRGVVCGQFCSPRSSTHAPVAPPFQRRKCPSTHSTSSYCMRAKFRFHF